MGFYAMLAQLTTLAILVLSPTSSSTANPTTTVIPKRRCDHQCGNVTIPYPFGMRAGCYLNEDFFINCNLSSNPPTAFLRRGNIIVTDIIIKQGQIQVSKLISHDCYDPQGNETSYKPRSFGLSKFTVSDTVNKFTAVGCDTYAIVRGLKGDGQNYTAGCMSICDQKEGVSVGSCTGAGCCQLSIPEGLRNFTVRLASYYNHTNVSDFNLYSYAFVAKESAFTFTKDSFLDLGLADPKKRLPLVLDWSIGNKTCEVAQTDMDTYACKALNSTCTTLPPVKGSGYICNCPNGYQGNPYLLDGCQDIEECKSSTLNKCLHPAVCHETAGSYTCTCPEGYHEDDRTDGYGCIADQSVGIIKIALGVSVGVTLLLVCSSWLYFGLQNRNLMKLKEKFFRQNGGFMLQQRLSGQESSTNIVKIFTSEELEKATNKYNESRIIGRGGFGTVYKGYLTDKRVVAIKKSKMVDQTQIEQFINEVIVLSKINHRNVVKLLGCCLETEVPLLVYEFISNGTLFEHLDNKAEASTLSWDTRLRIAAETAGVLSYLHSAASTPIIHRDIKSTNILLDDNYVAKVSDFGASRLVPLDHTQVSTMVQGTLGYLDPEYMQTSQLTEKSDVYSFGVVLIELLSGRKPLSFDIPEKERNLAIYFLSSLKEGRLSEVLEDRLVREGNTEQLKEVARLAKRCLNIKGEDRPTMKEVAMELEGLRLMTKHPWVKAELNSEETESLLGETSGVYGYTGGTTSTINVGYDSMRDHIIVPTNGGR